MIDNGALAEPLIPPFCFRDSLGPESSNRRSHWGAARASRTPLNPTGLQECISSCMTGHQLDSTIHFIFALLIFIATNLVVFFIITPVYNGACFVDGYIKCLKDQDFLDWESIIVDDRSTDNTFEEIKRLTAYDSRFTVFKNSSSLKKKISGPYQARNLAIKKARGHFICFLDIDDSWPLSKLSTTTHF